MDLGGKFWLGLIAAVVGVALAGVLLFWFFGTIWYSWGLLGAIAVFAVIALGFAYVVDRREKQRRSGLSS